MYKSAAAVQVAPVKAAPKRAAPRAAPARTELQDAPPIECIADLVKIGRGVTFYKNLDILSLWKITPHLEQLDEMVGLQSLKESIFLQVLYYLQGLHRKPKRRRQSESAASSAPADEENTDYLHTMIYGSPGTGKTTIAKIIGSIYVGLGVLSKTGVFKVAYRDDFISGYAGQSALKTRALLESCIGGTLFVDEIYSLAATNPEHDQFSQEAINILTAFLSEHKNDFCLIGAGYEDSVKQNLFSLNKGLKRRFPWVHRIETYTPVEMAQIFFKLLADSGWDHRLDVEWLARLIETNRDLFPCFGGDIETFLSKCRVFHSKRVFTLSAKDKYILIDKDVMTALEYLKGMAPSDTGHLIMYG